MQISHVAKWIPLFYVVVAEPQGRLGPISIYTTCTHLHTEESTLSGLPSLITRVWFDLDLK